MKIDDSNPLATRGRETALCLNIITRYLLQVFRVRVSAETAPEFK